SEKHPSREAVMKASWREIMWTYGQLAVALAAGAVVLGAAIVSPRTAAGNKESTIDRALTTDGKTAGTHAGATKETGSGVGEVKDYKMPDKKAEDPHSLVFDSDGILWFTVQVGNFVGRLDPGSGKVELQTVPTGNAHPYGIQVNSQGVPFFCEFFTNKLASI